MLVEGGDEDDGHLAADQLQHLEARELGHLDVEQDQVRSELGHRFHRLEAVTALPRHLDIGLAAQVLAEQLTRRILVVHDQDAHRARAGGGDRSGGRPGRH